MHNLRKVTLAILLSLIGFISVSMAQNIPVDFETDGNGANWNWKVFENDSDPALEIVDNPDKSGINTSCTVAKFTALQAGKPFAGCETLHGSDIGEFTIGETNKIIKIMVWKSVISDVGIKLVRSDNWSLGEIKIPNTKTNEWEVITFDFSAHVGNTYDQIVIFPDFDNSGRSQDNVIYFDNVYGTDSVENSCGTASVGEISQVDFTVYPNPTKGAINILSSQQVEEIQILDVQGKVLTVIDAKSHSATYDVSHWEKGMYLVQIKSRDIWTRKKFLLN